MIDVIQKLNEVKTELENALTQSERPNVHDSRKLEKLQSRMREIIQKVDGILSRLQ